MADKLQAVKSCFAGVSTSVREEVDITWTVENFKMVIESTKLFISQVLEEDTETDMNGMTHHCVFSVGSSTGVDSDKNVLLKFQLTVEMKVTEEDDDKVGLFVSLLNYNRPPTSPVLVTLNSIKIMLNGEAVKWFTDQKMLDLTVLPDWGYKNVIKMSEVDKFLDEKGSVTFQMKILYFKPPCKLLRLKQTGAGSGLTSALSQFQKEIESLLGDEATCDVEIKVTGASSKSFFAHKAILAARSTVFYAMFFKSEMRESFTGVVEVSDISVKTMEVFLNFLYTGCFKDNSILMEILSELVYAADKYDVKTLKDICVKSIIHNITTKNAMELFAVTKRHALHETSFCVLQFIAKNISDIL